MAWQGGTPRLARAVFAWSLLEADRQTVGSSDYNMIPHTLALQTAFLGFIFLIVSGEEERKRGRGVR
jgi:hypothetical protein